MRIENRAARRPLRKYASVEVYRKRERRSQQLPGARTEVYKVRAEKYILLDASGISFSGGKEAERKKKKKKWFREAVKWRRGGYSEEGVPRLKSQRVILFCRESNEDSDETRPVRSAMGAVTFSQKKTG